MQRGQLRASDSGVSGVVGSMLAIAITVMLTIVAAFLYDRFNSGASTPIDSGGRAAFTNNRYQVSLAGPDSITVGTDAKLLVTVDGVQQTLPLSAFASQLPDPNVWRVGDAICVVGPPPCPIPTGSLVGVQVVKGNVVVFDLPPLQYAVAGPTFLIKPNGAITMQCSAPSALRVIGQEYSGDPPVNVALSTTGAAPFTMLFGGADVDGGEVYDLGDVPAGATLGIQSTLNDGSGFVRTYDSFNPFDHTQWNDYQLGPHVYVLKNGDQGPPDLPPVSGQTSLAAFMGPYLNADHTMHLATNEVILLFEFYQLGTSGADFQDLVVLFQFNTTLC